MTSCLRSSGNLVRLSQRTARSASASHLSSSIRSPSVAAARCARHYATVQPGEPKDPKDPKENKKNAATGDASKKQGKSAPGMEHVYNQQSPLAKSPDGKTATSKLSAEDEKTLNEMTLMLKSGMGAAQREDFEKAVQAMKAEGIPDDLKEVMRKFRNREPMDLSTATKVIRITTRLARRAAQIHFDQDNSKTSQGRAQQKSGAHDPGPGSKKKQDGESNGWPTGGPSLGGLKLDTSTFLTTAFLAYMVYRSVSPGENTRDITWQEFRNQFLDKGLVEKLTVINRKQVRVTLNKEAVRAMYPDSPAAQSGFSYYFTIGDVGSFERNLDNAHAELQIPSNQRIPVSYDDETPWAATFFSFAPTLLLIGATYWLLRRSSGGGGGSSGIFGMGKSRAKKFNHETDVKVTFKDVAGMDEAKLEIMEFVSFLKQPEMYSKLGAKIPRGAILSGPPGTGKTLLAKATAGESGVPFFSVSGSEFVEMFVGVGASRVRDLFKEARKSTPCIIFIDEIDAIGKARGKNVMGGGNDEREATLNQILTEMDGFNTSEQVVVLAGTNRSDVLDKALMRPGRFDRHIHVDKPTMEGRKQIFEVHLRHIVTKEEPEYLRGRLAALTPGFSGADIANCVNEAALVAARHKADSVTMTHFESAIERVIGGLEKKSLVLAPEEKRTVAYHEAGHAICGWYFKYADPLLKVSIIPRGQGALGYAQYLPAGDTYLMNVNQLMDRMAMTLAGRVSEELHFETVTSGASDDFNKVTRMATAMVTKWGMSRKIGYLYYEDDSSQQLHKPFSEETARNIDSEVKRIVDEAYKQCRDLLTEKKREIGLVAEELLAKEVLGREDLIRLLGPRQWEDKGDFAKYFGSRGDREGVPGSVPPSSQGPDPEVGGGPLGGVASPTAFRRP